jgi:pyruvate dehydrogenase E1 component alpha subunit
MKKEEKGDVLGMYETMLKIRYFEEECHRRLRLGQTYGEVHQYIGQEAVAVGVCSLLDGSDVITSTHRGHGHIIARGGDINLMMAEIFGKESGYCKGKGGSFHVADFGLGIYGANGIVGAGVPHAVGAGYAAKLRNDGSVAVAFFGDGAINQGVVHESMNLAVVYQLPVIFVCENNGWAVSFSSHEASGVNDLALRAVGYGMPGRVVDGMDVLAMNAEASSAVAAARAGRGPQFIEAKTYRYEGHFSAEDALLGSRPYRDISEIKHWQAKDPLEFCERYLIATETATAEELESIRSSCMTRVVSAGEFANDASAPNPSEAFDDMYASSGASVLPKGW